MGGEEGEAGSSEKRLGGLREGNGGGNEHGQNKTAGMHENDMRNPLLCMLT